MGRWFATERGPGKVTLAQQLIGLERLPQVIGGRTILDVGCAEGDIGAWCLAAGALSVDGVESRTEAVENALRLGVGAVVADVATFEPQRDYDVILLLGILNKLPAPGVVLARLLARCRERAVLRLPAGQWPRLECSRCTADLRPATAGFEVEAFESGPKGQLVVYLRR